MPARCAAVASSRPAKESRAIKARVSAMRRRRG
jgi:hypothetical protein